MRLGRLVLAGLAAGVVAGFLVALLRPRGTHPGHPEELTADADLTAEPGAPPTVPPALTPGQGRWEAAPAVPGASRRTLPDGTRAPD